MVLKEHSGTTNQVGIFPITITNNPEIIIPKAPYFGYFTANNENNAPKIAGNT